MALSAQILQKLDDQAESIGEIGTQTALTRQAVDNMTPKLDKLYEVVITGNGHKPLVQRMDNAENFIDCKKAEEKEKKEGVNKFQWIIITALVGNILATAFAYFK